MYGGVGRRVKTTAPNGAVTYTLYDKAGQLLEDYQPASSHYTDYLYLAGKLVAQIAGQPDTPAPAVATGDALDGTYTVSWGAVTGANHYDLQVLGPDGHWTTVYSGSALSTSLAGQADGSYTYRVISCTGTTNSSCGLPGQPFTVTVNHAFLVPILYLLLN